MFEVPDKYRYEDMIHELMFAYKLSKKTVKKQFTEYDFYVLIANENMKAEKQEYIFNQNKQQRNGG